MSHLCPDGKRFDYCPDCFASITLPSEGFIWRAKIPEKARKRQLKDEKMLQSLLESADPKWRYVCVLYLERTKQIMRRSGTLYEEPLSGKVFDVPPVQISPQEQAELLKSWLILN